MSKVQRQGWRREFPFLLILFLPVAATVLGTITLHSASSRPDLSELVAKPGSQDREIKIVDWLNLSSPRANIPVRLLGYMMDTDMAIPDGEKVQAFVLMPEAGTTLHPAHRESDAMIRIQLRFGARVDYEHRRLVWVEGLLTPSFCPDCDGQPGHAVSQARVWTADYKDVRRYFRPQ